MLEQICHEEDCTTKKITHSINLDSTLARRFPLLILVVDDELINQLLARKILEKLGFHPHIANNGKEALLLMQKNRYDLLFMDLFMPELDGVSATRQMRKQSANKDQPVIIAMTANTGIEDKRRCLDAGMNDFVTKPIFPKTLQKLLNKWGQRICSSR